ncbi:MAG: hypothetical protein LBI96_03430 [Odoribacteraceae bacterium]|jgi:beta-mannosidase|nr:hypothetical protein [Odoribacteraceae bacterium]
MKRKTLLIAACLLALLPGIAAQAPANNAPDASALEWQLWCYRPNVWRMNFDFNRLAGTQAEHAAPMRVPGSVQAALLEAGLIEDWNIGLNSFKMEWIENRHWLVTARVPDDLLPGDGEKLFLQCDGLDYKGIFLVNGQEAGRFDNAFLPYAFPLSPFLKEGGNTIAFVFECPPENLAQIGWTSRITDWKPRFNYGWDWMPRIVQTGIWDDLYFRVVKEGEPAFEDIRVIASASKTGDIGTLTIDVKTSAPAIVRVALSDARGKKLLEETLPVDKQGARRTWEKLKIRRWWPNGLGEQPLYNVQITLTGEGGDIRQETRRVGFRHVEWLPCEGAPREADPWICSVNNRPLFLQGVNWTPIRPNFADLKREDYVKRLQLYRELGVNTIRVWGGGFPEKRWLYDLCDELGILVWQDFPLSSSGLDNYPPEGLSEVHAMTRIAARYAQRLRHHASLLLWCGGNELYERGDTEPVSDTHVMIDAIKNALALHDASRRFIVASPSGMNIYADRASFGSGKNWEVHGPWNLAACYAETDKTMSAVEDYWSRDDALFRSEVGVPGAMSLDAMNKYRGDYALLPASIENPLWRATVSWWIEWEEYIEANPDAANDAGEYVRWSQERQSRGLAIALKKAKDRFPACGGFIIWMGHDSFPCMVNTSILDFDGNPKPVARALSEIWRDNSVKTKP